MDLRSSKIGHLACFTAYAIFGFNIIVCKDLTSTHWISPLSLFCLRSVFAGALFWLISFMMPYEKVETKDFPKIALASLLGFFLTQYTFLMAIENITPMDCSIVSSLSPVYTMFIAAVALKEPITLRKAGGVVLSLAGIIFLILNSVGMASSGERSTNLTGILLMLANSFCFAMYLGIFKPIISKYSVITFMKWIFLFSTVMSLPFSFTEITSIDYTAQPANILWELTFLIVCSTFITYFLIPIGQQRIRPTLVSMYSYVQPIIAIAISICIGMDTLTWQKVLAAATVFTGVVIVSYSRGAKDGTAVKK